MFFLSKIKGKMKIIKVGIKFTTLWFVGKLQVIILDNLVYNRFEIHRWINMQILWQMG